MRRWLKVAVPLGLAAVLVSVLAIGFGSTSIDAAPGGNGKGKAKRLAVAVTAASGVNAGGPEAYRQDRHQQGREPQRYRYLKPSLHHTLPPM